MKDLLFTKASMQDLEGIYDYIALDNVESANKLIKKFQKCWQLIADKPSLGSKRNKFIKGLQSITEGNYVIFYRKNLNNIEIIRILHGARDIEKIFKTLETL